MSREDCPPLDVLNRYAVGALSEAEAEALSAHLGACADCLARLDHLADRTDPLLAALRKPAPPGPGNSHLERAVASVLAPPPVPAGPGPGAVLGGYRLREEIGRGGMGRVYRARHPRLDQEVALKVLRPGMDSAPILARFEAERQALALMDHPSIARVFDGGVTEDGRPFFVMELVQGVTVTRYCAERRLDLRRRLLLFIDICSAVQHAHQKGIIHRDLKPSNVLITEYDGRPVPKVIDFGVARALERRSATHTEVGMLIGTPQYMSPEQADLTSNDVDTRSDIYALGVLLYELLTGDTPITHDQLSNVPALEVLRMVREQEPPSPSSRLGATDTHVEASTRPGIDPVGLSRQVRGELDWIVMKALEKDRSRRYETANGFAADVQRYLNDEVVQACPPSAWYRLRKLAQRNKGPVLAAMILLVMLVAMLGLALVSNYQVNNALAGRNEAFTKLEDEQEKTAGALRRETAALAKQTEALSAKTRALEDLGKAKHETESANATLTEALEREQQAAYQHRIALAHREWLANNPVRSLQLLEECPEKYRHWEWHFLYRLHHTDLLTLIAGSYLSDVAYSPDGRLLASTGGMVRVWDPRTGRLLHTLSGHTGQVYRVVFSPDGSRLATSGRDGSLRVWDAATGQQVVSIDRPTGNHSTGLAFSPDSRQIASEEGGPKSTAVKFWDVATGKELFSWQAPEPPPGSRNLVHGVALSPDGKYMAVYSFNAIWLVEIETKKSVPLRLSTYNVHRVVFSRDGGRLAACCKGQVRIWHVPSGNVQSTVDFSGEFIWGLDFSLDGRRLAVSYDYTVHVHDAADGREILALRGHFDVVTAAVFSPNGRQVASAGHDGTIRFWDITAPQEGPRLSGSTAGARTATFSDDSQRLTAIAPRLQTWELSTGRILFARPFGIVPGATALSLDGRYLAGTNSGNLFVFEVTTGKQRFAQPSDRTSELAFSPDGRLLAEGSLGGGVRVRDGQTGRILQSLQGHPHSSANAPVRVAFSPDGSRLASACWKPDVKIWDTGTWQELFSLNGHRTMVYSLAFSHDNRYLASGGHDKTIGVWDAATGTKLFDLSGQATPVTCVTFSPDGKRLFSCGSEGSINVWDLQNRVKLLTLHYRGHFVAVSPDGRRLATCEIGSPTFQVWDSEVLSRAERWKRHQERIPFWQPQVAGSPKTATRSGP